MKGGAELARKSVEVLGGQTEEIAIDVSARDKSGEPLAAQYNAAFSLAAQRKATTAVMIPKKHLELKSAISHTDGNILLFDVMERIDVNSNRSCLPQAMAAIVFSVK